MMLTSDGLRPVVSLGTPGTERGAGVEDFTQELYLFMVFGTE